MEANNSSLELFEISYMMEHLVNIVLELFLVVLLLIQVSPQLLYIVCESLLSHSEIVHDKCQILIDSVEMLELLSHLVGLLVQSLDIKLSWSNLSLELLDLVIKNELKLFELLCLLFEVDDPLVFVFDGCASFFELTFLTFNLLL